MGFACGGTIILEIEKGEMDLNQLGASEFAPQAAACIINHHSMIQYASSLEDKEIEKVQRRIPFDASALL